MYDKRLIVLFYRPQNMIAQSQSGTGKTAAFVLAMLSRTDTSKNYPHVVCLSPTFELAIQTGEVAKKMAKFCPNIKIRHAVRGERLSRRSYAYAPCEPGGSRVRGGHGFHRA